MEQQIFCPRFPYGDEIQIDGIPFSSQHLVDGLAPYLSEQRLEKIEKVISNRTCNLSLVTDQLYDIGNINALLRTCENLGILNCHVIEASRMKITSRTTQGADKWVNIKRWQRPTECIETLKSQGHQIIATDFSDDAIHISEVDFNIPTAIILGSEHLGVSEEILKLADKKVKLPAVGFSQSYNVSVAGAMLVGRAFEERVNQFGKMGDLNIHETNRLRAEYYRRSLRPGLHKVQRILKKLVEHYLPETTS